jgi:hypothetical protein
MGALPSPDRGTGQGAREGYYFVLDEHDRITYVSTDLEEGISPFVGRTAWERLPGAEPFLRPRFDEARRSGGEVAFPIFYAGRAKHIRAIPAADGLAVHVEQLTAVDVRTLATLAESLRRIEDELAGRASVRLDPPAHGSLQALP